MKKLLLALALFAIPASASAQCSGVFAAASVCGTILGGVPGQVALSSIPVVPASSVTLHVNTSTGVDSGTCTASAPCLTTGFAAGIIQSQQVRSPTGGTFPIIQIDSCSSFTETVEFKGTGEALNGALIIKGTPATPSSCVWNTAAISVDKGAIILFDGFTFRTTAPGLNVFNIGKGGIAGVVNDIASSTGGASNAYVYIQAGGVFITEDPFDGAGIHQAGDVSCAPTCFNYYVQNKGGQWQSTGQTISKPNALTGTAWYQGDGTTAQAFFTAAQTYTGSAFTGLQYQLLNGALGISGGVTDTVKGTTFPGTSTGTIAPPAYVLPQNGQTLLSLSNTSTGVNAQVGYSVVSSAGAALFGAVNSSYAGLSVFVNRAFIYSTLGLVFDASGANPILFASNDLEVGRWDSVVPGKLLLGVAGTTVGQACFGNATSGTECIVPATGALVSGVATLPAGTYNIVGDSLTQALTGKTISGASNTLSSIALSSLSTQATNTVVGNATSGSASPTALAVGSCSTVSSALIWTTNTGFGCNTSITANAVPAANLTGATLAAGVTASSLTSLGTITSLTATTINGFTLGGTIAGGGNQLNNIIIGTSTPLAGTFTTLTANTSISSPTHTASGALTFQSNGSTFAGNISTGQQWLLGTTAITPASGVELTVSKNSGTPTVGPIAGTVLDVLQVDGTNSRIAIRSFGTTGGASVVYMAAAGTAAAPTATQNGSFLGVNFGWGYSAASSAYLTGAGAGFAMVATENYDATHGGAELQIYTTVNATTSQVNSMSVKNSGGLAMAGNADPGAANIAATRYFSGSTGGLASKSCIFNTSNVTTGITLTITGGLVTGTTTC